MGEGEEGGERGEECKGGEVERERGKTKKTVYKQKQKETHSSGSSLKSMNGGNKTSRKVMS